MSLALGLALLLAAGGPGDPDVHAAFAEALGGLEAGAGARELDERAGKLALLPGASAEWLAVESAEGDPLAGAQVDLLDRIASRLPREAVIESVREAQAANGSAAWRGAALKLLGRHASAEDVPLLVDLLRTDEGRLSVEGPLADAFESTLAEIARRDLRIAARMPWFAENAPALRPALVRALGSSGDPEALPTLTAALQDRDLALMAIRQIARLAGKAPPELRGELSTRVRPFLVWADEATRRHAMRALVALEDESSVPELLKIVEADATVRHDAEYEALRGLTGRNLPAEAARWRSWYDSERRWLEQDASAAIGRLVSDEPGRVVAAIREIADHGLERGRLAEALSRVLREHASAAVRNQACLGLAKLRSRAGLEALTLALSDADPVVAGNALSALRTISGLSLPLNAKAWQDALRTGS
jgi:hypothetical protein